MALDGIVIANLVSELNKTILNSKIAKIAQPEQDELLLTCKGSNGQYRLAISASASLPFLYLTNDNKPSPMTAPTFCMVLRKHIANGRIIKIEQPSLERIVRFEIEHLDEMGDLKVKTLIVELMGKHSNIIFADDQGKIIDSIKHISLFTSSIREVLPGKIYETPSTQDDKANPLEADIDSMLETLRNKPDTLAKAIYSSYVGISPLIAHQVIYAAGGDGDMPVASFSEDQLIHIIHHFLYLMDDIRKENFTPNIVRKETEPIEFSSVPLTQYSDLDINEYDSISKVLEQYYAERNAYTRIRQKSSDLRRIVNTALERNQKKYQLQLKQLRDTEKRDKYKVYGELIQAFGYGLEPGSKKLICQNYYDENKEISIPLDETKTPMENSQKYFEKYNKMKRTFEALSQFSMETKAEIDHLESIQNSLDIAVSSDDLTQIKQELTDFGFIKKHKGGKKIVIKSKPFHYQSSEGYDIYVGKNNYQNDELTFKFATGNDWWFHAKGIPGSHVVVKANNTELPDKTFEEAAALAAYYSKGSKNDKIEIDYLQKKNVKKPNGSAPGFVVYYTNYSMAIKPSIKDVTLISD